MARVGSRLEDTRMPETVRATLRLPPSVLSQGSAGGIKQHLVPALGRKAMYFWLSGLT